MSQNGLRDSKCRHHENEDRVKEEKAAQFLFGFDEGMTPPELLLASLGSCAAYYAVDYLVRNKIAREGVKTRVTAEKVKGPFRVDNFKIEVEVPGDLTAEQLKGLEDAVHRCLIHNTLLQPPKIEVAIKVAVLA